MRNVECRCVLPRCGSPSREKSAGAEAFERVGLSDRMKHRPRRCRRGEQAEGSIGSVALVNRPKILLADRTTANRIQQTARDNGPDPGTQSHAEGDRDYGDA